MSKPKPGLGKGIARTIAHSHSVPSAPAAVLHHPVALAPVFSTPTRSLHLSSQARPATWSTAAVQTQLSLLPLWDAPAEFGRRTYVTATSSLRASPVVVEATSTGSFVVPPYHPTSLLSDHPPKVLFNEFYTYPPPPPPPPAIVLRPSPPHPAAQPQQPRTQAAHGIISPNPQAQSGPSPSPSPPLTFLGIRAEEVDIQNGTSIPDPNNLSVYSSNLIFHLGASGCPKERPPAPPSRRPAATPPPPRPRSFPLPDITPPTTLQSTAVGEDSYFARVDGVCVADGVGGWSRSGKGADPGRWSRLLTHFCEEEVARWWAGTDDYIATEEEVSGWAARAWKRSSEGGRHRRPLDPVEIMQKGYEKCLACAATEVSHRHLIGDTLLTCAGYLRVVDMPARIAAPLDTVGRQRWRLQSSSHPPRRGRLPNVGNAACVQLPPPARHPFARRANEGCQALRHSRREGRRCHCWQRWSDGQLGTFGHPVLFLLFLLTMPSLTKTFLRPSPNLRHPKDPTPRPRCPPSPPNSSLKPFATAREPCPSK